MQAAIKTRFDAINDQFNGINTRLDDIENLIYEVMVEADERFEKVNQGLSEVLALGTRVCTLFS